jgi:invasion protein IalB
VNGGAINFASLTGLRPASAGTSGLQTTGGFETMLSGSSDAPRQPASIGLRWAGWFFFTALALCAGLTGVSSVGLAGDAKPAAPPSPPATDPADGVVRGQHGDWQIVCKPPPAGAKNEVCALVQSVTAEDRSNVGLTIYFQRFSNGTQVLRVFAPLGVLLPPGVGLKIDDVDVGHAPFHRCQSFACYAQVTVDDKLLGQLSTGKTAIFIIFQTEEAGIGIPISLAGFPDAVSGLNQ